MNILERISKKGDKITFYYDYGRGPGQRPSTGIFIYTRPKDQIQKNHNKEARSLLEIKKSQLTIEQQAIGSVYIPGHKFKANFLDYYEEYITLNKRKGNRHLECSLSQFKKFINKDFISPVEITENLCKRFRRFLLDRLKGQSPQNYYARFKWVVNAATNDHYFQKNPTEDVAAKANPSAKLKDFLEAEEVLSILSTPCTNEEVKFAGIFCCYTGLRWCDVNPLAWSDIKGDVLVTRIIQAKTGQPITLTLHPIAKRILELQKAKAEAINSKVKIVFNLPSSTDANKMVKEWVHKAGINKYITWSCFRLSFSILLQDKHVDDATVAYLLGHTTTKQVRETYKRHRPKDQKASISHLPAPEQMPYFLKLP